MSRPQRTGSQFFSYANIVATLALVLTLGGGTALAVDKIKSKDIAKHAVKSKHLARSAVTAPKIKNGSVQLGDLQEGVAGGKVILRAAADNLAGVTTNSPSNLGVEIPLTGSTTFTPKPGRVYSLVHELRGNPVDGDAGAGGTCEPAVDLWVNDEFWQGQRLVGDATLAPQFQAPIASNDSTLGMTTTGQPLTIKARLYGDSDCGAGTTIAALRIAVIEYN
jgi:hypothetical protein